MYDLMLYARFRTGSRWGCPSWYLFIKWVGSAQLGALAVYSENSGDRTCPARVWKMFDMVILCLDAPGSVFQPGRVEIVGGT